MKKGNKIKKGFTLIELITVVIIIAILAALALPQYTRFIERSHGSTAKNALAILRKAEANYFALNSQYVSCSDGACSALSGETPEVAKIVNNTAEWTYTVTADSTVNNSTFISVARRMKGVYSSGANITLNQDGAFTFNNGTVTITPTAESLWK